MKKRNTRLSNAEILALALDFQNTGNIKARNAIVNSFMGLANDVAGKYVRRGLDYDELQQEAVIALMKAIKEFDPKRGVKFSTYAQMRISKSLLRTVQNKGKVIRTPVKVATAAYIVQKLTEKFLQCHCRHPRFDEIAELTGFSPSLLNRVRFSQKRVVSSINFKSNTQRNKITNDVLDMLCSSNLNPEMATLAKDEYEVVKRKISAFIRRVESLTLSVKIKTSFLRRYGLLDESFEEITYQTMAAEEGISYKTIQLRMPKVWKRFKKSGEVNTQTQLRNLLERFRNLQDLTECLENN